MLFQDECREMLCQNGAIKTPDGCKQFTINWDNARYILSVLLTPLNKWIPLQQFANLRGNFNQNYKKTFKSNGIPLDTFKLYINATEKGNVSFVETLHLILGDKHFSGKMKEVLDLIRSAMSKTWNIRLDKLYVFDAAFGKTLHIYGIEYETYIDNQPNASSKTQQLVYFKEFQRSYKSGLYLNKLYFCKQVELLPGEWIKLDRDEVQLNLTEGNGKILGDAEYIYTGDDLERMRICVDDFNPVYSDEHVVVSNGNKLAVVGNSAIQIMLCVVHVFMKINQ